MARVIEAVQIFKKVEDVTAAKEDPSPVYLMDELADMARGSMDAAEKVADRIAKRLQNKSPVVKFKALRLIRHIVNKGCGQFQRSMQRHAELVRSHMHFKGDPDPYKGDIPNQRVRDAAKEAAEALFNTVMTQPVNALGSRIQGFGSSAAPAASNSKPDGNSFSGASSAASSSRMMGFGSGNYSAPSTASAGNGTGSSNGFGTFGTSQKASPAGVNRPLTSGYGGEAGRPTSGSSGGHASGYSAPSIAAVQVLGSEEQLVDSVCTPGGLRLAPDPDDLRRFVEAVGSLDGLKVAELLRDKMDGSSGPWQQQLRALYALEAVLLQGASQACGEVAVLFQSDPGPVQAAASHTQPALRERAARVLKLLLGDDAAASSAKLPAQQQQQQQQQHAAAAVAAPQPQQAPVDLLGGLDMLGGHLPAAHPAQPPHHPHVQRHQGPPGAADGDMFSGLAVPAANAFPQQNPYQQPLPATVAAARPAVADPFETMQAAIPSTSAAAASMPPPAHQRPQFQQQGQPAGPSNIGPGGVGNSGQAGVGGTGLGAPAPLSQGSSYYAASGPSTSGPSAGSRPPLDEMFADMSLAGGGLGAAPAAPPLSAYAAGGGAGAGAGGGGGGAYGVLNQPYGVAPSGGSSSGLANPIGYGSGSVPPGPTPYAVGPQNHGSFGPNVSGVGTPVAVTNNYGTPHQQQLPGLGPGPQVPPQQMNKPVQPLLQPQQQPYAAGVPPVADLLGGGYDVLGGGVPANMGPSVGSGMGGWPAGGGLGAYGQHPGPGAGAPLGPGMAAGSNGMMVGPGGQVQYVGGPAGQPSGRMGGYGASGGAAAPLQQQSQGYQAAGQGGWQQPYAMQQQQQHPPYGVTAQPHPPQQRSGGGAAFDFVQDQFKK